MAATGQRMSGRRQMKIVVGRSSVFEYGIVRRMPVREGSI